jgi:hypothetical protein
MRNFLMKVLSSFRRETFAYLFMLSFIILSSIGAAFIYPPAGLITAGVASGIFGYLLGRE